MQQLNTLPINVSQGAEVKDESQSFLSSTSGNEFSQLMDQHLAENNAAAVDKHSSSAQEVARHEYNKTAQDHKNKPAEQVLNNDKLNDATVDSTEKPPATDDTAHKQQEIATSGNNGQVTGDDAELDQIDLSAAEQLMAFFAKADTTATHLIANEELTTLSALDVAQYQDNLLSKVKGSAEGLPANVSAVISLDVEQKLAQKTLLNDKKASLTLADMIAEEKGLKGLIKLPVEPIINPTDDKATIDSKEITSDEIPSSTLKAQSLISKQQGEVINSAVEQVQAATEKVAHNSAKPIATNSNIALSDILPTNEIKQSAELVEQAAKQTLNVDDKVITEIASSEKVLVTTKKSSEQITAGPVKLHEKLLTKELAAEAINMAEQKSALDGKEQAVTAVGRNSISSEQMAIEQASKNQAKHGSEVLKFSAQTANAQVKLAQSSVATTSVEQASQEKSSNKSINELSTQQIIDSQAIKANLTEQAQPKDTPKAEEKIEQGQNALVSSGGFIDVTGRATQTAQEFAEQSSANVLNPSVSMEAIQSQKSNAQLHQETIAIFRKDFTDAVKDRVMVMISQKLQQFDITLDPPELGNMQVRVNLQGEQAVVNFMVQNQQAKEALEQNMHKLRDMLAEQGVDVGDANVEQQSNQSDDNGEESSNQQGENIAQVDDVIEHSLSAQTLENSSSVVDYYV